ncbi:KinB-signaling pathway activation protein [Alicyclobacillus sp. SO9]|uniref:KinB-signaling pathway activation protein n=1 Tax=Alicyclobacillus sp. SO9 TaxID=2665646 RepID=UPI0018E908FA|nr:KinB-signaling pathway activation protein [Alicyclobacillus sp. SO9]QQE78496.1 KinB-signaling pathway activation protein [Alicyclobacillus sp. SO9]
MAVVRLNRFLFLLLSTVALGAVVGLITSTSGLIHMQWTNGLVEGAFMATTSLMGFWAYLTVNFLARATLSRQQWRWLQVIVLLFVAYDMFWWRYSIDKASHPIGHPSYTVFLVQALWPLLGALLAAFFKRQLSGPGSYLPTVFYLYVFMVIDWLLVIRQHWDPAIVNQTGIVMMACNIYMILIFGKLLTPRQTETASSPQP